jgi:hypothetical protein
LRPVIRRTCEYIRGREVQVLRWVRFDPDLGIIPGGARENLSNLGNEIAPSLHPESHQAVDFVTGNASLYDALRGREDWPESEKRDRILQELLAPILVAYLNRTREIEYEDPTDVKARMDAIVRQVRRIREVRYDEDSFDTIFGQVASELRSRRVPVARLSPIMNVRLDSDPITFRPGLRLRRIESEDGERWINVARPPIATGGMFAALHFQCIVEETWDHDVDGELSAGPSDDAQRVITAVRLIAEQETKITVPFSEHLPLGVLWTRKFGHFGFGPSQGWPGNRLTIEAAKAPGIRTLWAQLRDSINAERLAVARRRWDGADERFRDDDRLIDYWIALESLFSTRDEPTEITYRTSMRIAAFTGETPEERVSVKGLMSKSYQCRSDIVHGKNVTPARLREQVVQTRTYLRRSLLKALGSNAPLDAKGIDSLLLKRPPLPEEH